MSLTKHDLEGFEKQLSNDLNGIEKTLKHLSDGMDFGDDVDHFDEEADEAEELANRLGMKQKLQERLENIKIALQKIKNGKYGACENCGKPIDTEVLHAAPESGFCRNCKKQQ